MLQAADARSSARSGGAAAGRRPVRSAPLPQRAARRPRTAAAASAGGAEPSVTLKFVDAAAPGPIEVSAPSGEQLRATMLENKVRAAGGGAAPQQPHCTLPQPRVCSRLHNALAPTAQVDLYTTWGKIWSCGGVGQCGTCIVKVGQRVQRMHARLCARGPPACMGTARRARGCPALLLAAAAAAANRRMAASSTGRATRSTAQPLFNPSTRAFIALASPADPTQIEEGAELLSERTATEQRKLKGVSHAAARCAAPAPAAAPAAAPAVACSGAQHLA